MIRSAYIQNDDVGVALAVLNRRVEVVIAGPSDIYTRDTLSRLVGEFIKDEGDVADLRRMASVFARCLNRLNAAADALEPST